MERLNVSISRIMDPTRFFFFLICPNLPKDVDICHIYIDILQTFKPSYPIPSSSNTAIFFVDAEKGSDSAADGKSPDSAFKSFEKALEAVRSARANGAVSKGAIVLREGVYYLKNTVKLTEADSDLTIQNYKDEKPILSGGRKLVQRLCVCV